MSFSTLGGMLLLLIVLGILVYVVVFAGETTQRPFGECPGECKPSCGFTQTQWGSNRACSEESPEGESYVCCVDPGGFNEE